MIVVALGAGIFAYLIYILGLLGLLFAWSVIPLIVCAVGLLIYYSSKQIKKISFLPFTRSHAFLLLLLFLQIGVNMVGVLGPEIGFDALWYHLTFPKLYLLTHTISHIPGGLLYYSDMPKLLEMLYTAGLFIGNETVAKLIHMGFGIMTCVILYQFSRKYMTVFFSLLTVIVFYSNLVVGWESISAYIDLGRTFFEFFSFVILLQYLEKKRRNLLFFSAVMFGLAISTKLLALSSLPIYVFILIVAQLQGKNMKDIGRDVLFFVGLSLFIPSPWFIQAYLATGNPFYPFFTHLYGQVREYGDISAIRFVRDIWQLFTQAPDPISPLYGIFLPLVILLRKKIPRVVSFTLIYIFFSIIIWYILPRVGGGRFILPYLPVFSFFIVYVLFLLRESKQSRLIVGAGIGLIILYAVLFIVYRGMANAKYIPYLLGNESKDTFLTKHLNFQYGDFYDTDKFFAQTIKNEDTVLLIGFHNLYYVNFPFIDSSYVKKGDKFTYIAVQDAELPERFRYWNLVHTNPTTNVRVYTAGGIQWVY